MSDSSEEYVKPTDKPEGAIGPEDLAQEEVTYDAPNARPEIVPEDVSKVAKEVIAGEWGVGQDRRLKLSQAGFDVKAVEKEVTRLRNS